MAELLLPDANTLRDFLLGRLTGPDADRVERYLESHPEAADTLHLLSSDDTFTSALREPPIEVQPAVQEVMDKLERMVRIGDDHTTPIGSADDSRAERAAIGEDTEDGLAFLSPAQQPGELGRLGGYRILRVLGTGGMGMVLDAEDPRLGRHVAIKVMRPRVAGNANAVKRFLREASAAAKVEHDHIIPIFQIAEERGIPYIVMPFLKGESLGTRLKREGRLPVADILRIGRETAEGLAAAHELGLVHRDIKPANLWLESPRGRVKILDFGLARLTADEGHLTQSGAIVGTPAYMSPEQGRGHSVDGRCDLFSLGAVLYRMATARTPFTGVDTMSILMSLATDTPAHPLALNPDLPPQLGELIVRLLEKDPARRPQSAREVVRLLHPAPMVEALPTDSGERRAEFNFDALDDVTQVDQAPAASPAKPEARRDHSKPRRGLMLAFAAAILVLISGSFGAYKLIYETKDGTLIVVIDDKEAEARFRNGELQLLDAEGKVKYTLKPSEKNAKVAPGDYQVRVSDPNGLEVDTPEFTIKKGDKVTVRVTAKGPAGVAKKDVRVPPDTDRKVAEWVLSVGGAVHVICDGVEIHVGGKSAQLPNKPFRIDTLVLDGQNSTQKVDDAALENLREIKDLRYALYLHGLPITDKGLLRLTQFPGLSNLEGLTITRSPITDAGLKHLRAMKLKRVELHGCTAIGSSGLAELAAMKTLTYVGLGSTNIEDASLIHLKALTELESLNLLNAKVTDAGLATLAELKNLRELSLENVPVTDSGVSRLRNLPKLTTLDLRGTKVTDAVLENLSGLQFVVLTLGGCMGIDGSGFVHLKDKVNLQDLRFNATNVTDAAIRHLEGLPALESIEMSGTQIGDAGFTSLTRLKKLTRLNALDMAITDAQLLILVQAKNLSELNVSRCPKITAEGINKLAAVLPYCKIVSDHGTITPQSPDRKAAEWVRNTKGRVWISVRGGPEQELPFDQAVPNDPFTIRYILVSNRSIADAELDALAQLPELHTVNFANCDFELPPLTKFKALKSLFADRAIIRHATSIRDCKNLYDLSLDGINNPPPLIQNLAGLKLGKLTLSRTPLSEPDLKDVAKIKSLHTLALDGTDVTDAGCKHLESLNNLGGLQLLKTKVTAEGVKQLAAALPNCKIESDHGIFRPQSDPDRRAAEWVLSIGGTITIKENGKERQFTAVSELPRGAFELMVVQSVGNVKVSDAGLAHFKDCKNLTNLSLDFCSVSDAGLAHFKDCKNLTQLTLSATQLSDVGLANFKDCKNLTSLELHSTRLSDAGLANFKDCKNLTNLHLGNNQVSDAGLGNFNDCKNLTSLSLGKTQVTEAGVKKLAAALPKCKIVSDYGTFGPSSDSERSVAGWVLRHGGTLSVLFKNEAVHVATAQQLPEGRIRIIAIDFSDPARAPTEADLLANLRGLAGVDSVLAISSPLTDAGLGQLVSMPALAPTQKLALRSTKVSAAGLAHLERLPKLIRLSLGDANTTDAELEPLKKLKSIIEISLIQSKITDAGLAKLRALENLEWLDLNGSRGFTDTGLKHLSSRPRLWFLGLDSTSVTDAGLANLAESTQFTHLYLLGTAVTDAGLAHLRGLTKMRELRLRDTKVTDAGLAHLTGLTKLFGLNLQSTKVTAEGVKKLAIALPNCRIEWDGGVIEPTNGATPMATADARTGLEWVLSVGGSVRVVVDGQLQKIVAGKRLPDKPFAVYDVNLDELNAFNDQAVENLQAVELNGGHSNGLSASGSAVTDVGIAKLATYPGFRVMSSLYVSRTATTDIGLHHMSQFKSLRFLVLSDTKVSDAGLKHLKDLKLEWLRFDGCKGINGSGFVHIERMSSLRVVELAGCPIDGANLKFLKDLKLEQFGLNTAQTNGDSAIGHLSEMTSLKYLHLSTGGAGPGITDQGVAKLQKLTRLMELNLIHNGAGLTDKSLEVVSRFTDLTSLKLVGTKVTADGVKKLAVARPKLRIEWDGGVIEPTGAGKK